ncbi:MAG: N-acetyl sugar amidotransferase [Bacteroidetes bacterium]|nr:N-acetyl sugar amidotransferase [Bacteroidota bacterium]
MVVCRKCILDSNDDPNLELDVNGVCQYCRYYDDLKARTVLTGDTAKKKIEETIKKIKADKTGEYDSILGLSGGVDSSYLAYLAKQYGLNPLCVHFDNGWNSEQAVSNIENIISKCGFDLSTYVINWEEFRDLQRAYFQASVVDIEAITDHAIFATMNRIAMEHNIKYVLSGFNTVTEGIMIQGWTHKKSDYINIRDIHSKYGSVRLKTFPFMDRKTKKKIRKLDEIEMLNWIDYNKKKVKEILAREFGWKDYGGKHYESIFTRFYQGYILPVKFKIDKRKVHLSNLICSGQITREEALEEMKKPAYDPAQLEIDKEFVLKKLGYTNEEFDKIMNAPVVPHKKFKIEGSLFNYYPVLTPLRPLWQLYKRVTNKP